MPHHAGTPWPLTVLRELLREDDVYEVGVVCTVHSETNSDKVSFTTLHSENRCIH